MIVGDHYSSVRTAALYATVYYTYARILNPPTPHGSTWAEFQAASCPKPTFCMMVGQAGTTRKTSRGVLYYPHAIAYTWHGKGAGQIHVPAPPRARNSELAGLNCPTSSMCVAVGNYTTAAGKWRTYADLWRAGRWQVELTRNASGMASSTFNDVSCPTATACTAVGFSQKPGERPFVESWNGSRWRVTATPVRRNASLVGVSCPTSARCFAAGSDGSRALLETWNGISWRVQKTARTSAPESADGLMHVSCVTATECVTVGYRYNPRVKVRDRTFRTLAEEWNGTDWRVQSTPNDNDLHSAGNR